MTVRTATANTVASIFLAGVRRMLLRRFTKSNLPAAIDGGAARVRRDLFELSRSDSTQANVTYATHPRFDLRAYGRLRFDANREVLVRRDDRVANIYLG